MRTFNIFKEILKNFREQDYFCQRLVAQTFPEEKQVKISHNNGNHYINAYLSMALVLWLMVRFSKPLQRLTRISSVVQIYSTVGVLVPEYWTKSLLNKTAPGQFLPICLLKTWLKISTLSFRASNSTFCRFFIRREMTAELYISCDIWAAEKMTWTGVSINQEISPSTMSDCWSLSQLKSKEDMVKMYLLKQTPSQYFSLVSTLKDAKKKYLNALLQWSFWNNWDNS